MQNNMWKMVLFNIIENYSGIIFNDKMIKNESSLLWLIYI